MTKNNTKKNLRSKDLRKRRVTRYFIDATREIIQESGLDGATIRTISERAGYNSATLYNYFESLDHLITITCVDLIKDWIFELFEIMESDNDELDKYILGWIAYCDYSFRNPIGFSYIYSEKAKGSFGFFEDYLEIFPEYYEDIPSELLEIYKKKTLCEQEEYVVAPCIEAGYFTAESAEDIYTLAHILHKGILSDIARNNSTDTHDRYTKIFTKYFVEYIQTKLIVKKDISGFLE